MVEKFFPQWMTVQHELDVNILECGMAMALDVSLSRSTLQQNFSRKLFKGAVPN